ncbi:LacI family DNA-binding transcriptional regulator [uncultured Subdoligranulum sp.]|uniref:LacI family DNA-binding transcriptional regulator n=1 Tax=uncultured Subdoligranulum sp. TaxID=512298 RepID=UPI002601E00E|nr:LacI family DNA-binding transcriptional regulator [uncultured Subdoligranulum sp.]
MCKLTMQDIADALSTSRVTVWKALNNRPGVSDTLRRQIQEKAREMGYAPAGAVPLAAPETPHGRNVAVVVCRPESSLFWMQIIHQIAKDLSEQSVNLMYTYLPTSCKEGYVLPGSLTDGSVEGIIVLNVYSEQLLTMLAALPQPKVYLDTIPTLPFSGLHGDLLLIEGRASLRQITGRLLDQGRTRLGFLGDVNYAQTNTDRYQGFLDAFAERGLKPDPALCLTGPLGLRTHYEEISYFLEHLPARPDGFVCVSDYIAHFIQRYFEEHGTDPEGRIALTGFDNNAEYLNVAERITTVEVHPKTLGARLANKILFLLEHPGVGREVSYAATEVLYRGLLAGQD